MLELEQLRLTLLAMKKDLEDLGDALGKTQLQNSLRELEETTQIPGFWNDLERSKSTNQRISQIKEKIDSHDSLCQLYEDTLTLVEIALEEQEPSVLEEAKQGYQTILQRFSEMRLTTLLTGEYDGRNAILGFHAGAGGTEAQDWVEMLLRMYTMWAERHGYRHKLLDYLAGEEAGVKSASLLIEGRNVYGFLRSETGVHRLVRISPFDSSGRRHTSFASLEVMPEIDDDLELVINDADLRIDTYRAGGAGGQHVNKTESAVRITHLPTGVVAACQNERSQIRNREVAMKMLKSKLVEIKERAHLERIEDIKGDQKDIGWGNQIRSYVFMPYTLVKDHRTSWECGNIGAVMDGDLDDFINAYLKLGSREMASGSQPTE